MQLATIGYEGAAIADFVGTLTQVGIERVIDVREIAQSRRPGFSKNALRTALAEVQIDYFHIRQLGDPKHGREAARSGNFELFRSIFNSHLDSLASKQALTEAIALATEKRSVLVCFERSPRHCHRAIVAERMAVLGYLDVRNLGVQPKLSQGAEDHAEPARRIAGAC